MLSKRAKYGIRALIYLAQRRDQGPVHAGVIALDLKIPGKFLETILVEFRKQGWLHSRRGRSGGYSMERCPDTITLARVIRSLDGPLAIVPCVSQTAYARCDDCPDEQQCAIRRVLKQVRDSTANILDSTTLAQLANGTIKVADLHPPPISVAP